MATTTPNYLWSVPTSSDLVKNGATAIETLGDSVDASLWNSGYGQAGKNKALNGDFSIWQRGTTFNAAASSSFTADRYFPQYDGGGTRNITRQTFTPGTAPVAGYEGSYFLRWDQTVATSAGTFSGLYQRMEDVRTFAGQTVTVSFWAKTDSARTTYAASGLAQNFGTGGSPSAGVNANASSTFSFTNSWARYSFTVAVPSISGKTIGTNNDSYLQLAIRLFNNTTFTFDIWGLQVEYGSIATPFQTASGGSPQAELAMCQRYYYRLTASLMAWGANYSATVFRGAVYFPVEMRTTPTAVEQTGTATDYRISQAGIGTVVLSAVPSFSGTSTRFATVNGVVTAGLTIFNPGYIELNAGTPYLGWSAEL